MKLSITRGPARAAACTAIAARLLLGLMVEAPVTHNGAWLSAIMGGLLAAPWLLCVQYLRRRSSDNPALLSFVLMALTIWDAAVVLNAVTRSAGYLALDRSPPAVLALPIGLAALWCVYRNGDAVGYGAMLWARIALILLPGIALLQVRYLRSEWLWPLLGSGWQAIFDGAVESAGSIVAAAAVLLLEDEKSEGASKQPSPMPMLAGAVATAVAMILLRLMMTPTQLDDGGWVNRLDSLLCNGRAPLYLQLPLIVMWFGGLLHLLACECFAASAFLQQLCAPLTGRLCGLLIVSGVLLLSRFEALVGLRGAVSRWSFAAAGILTALTMLRSAKPKGGLAECAPDH
ncbi:MAG: hypothetical protein IJ769_09300 [Clostridia bacterium]|nr:hypothetical protein [Clostridia bacterium]